MTAKHAATAIVLNPMTKCASQARHEIPNLTRLARTGCSESQYQLARRYASLRSLQQRKEQSQNQPIVSLSADVVFPTPASDLPQQEQCALDLAREEWHWLNKAASQNHSVALFEMGKRHFGTCSQNQPLCDSFLNANSVDFSPCYSKGMEYLHRASQQGHVYARVMFRRMAFQ